MKKAVLLAFVLVLSSVSMFVESMKPVEASGTIYIRLDGSIDPPTANITTSDNVTYTFTDNNYDSIVVEKDNIIIDGNEYTLQGTGRGTGVSLSGRTNVTVKNVQIKYFHLGIGLLYSSNNSIRGISFTNNGLFIWDSHQNSVENNTVNGKPLVYLEDVEDYSVGDAGQVILVTSNNIRVENLSLFWTGIGVQLWKTNNSIISGNNLTYESRIGLYHSSNNSIRGNNVAYNEVGIVLSHSSNNRISGNNITRSSDYGIWLYFSSNNSISGNNIENNSSGIGLDDSNSNIISGNNITDNSSGIWGVFSSNNIIYHNNFIDNAAQTSILNSIGIWDNGFEGNYWSTYNGTDADYNGIGDTSYIIDTNNTDNYPLMGMFYEFEATPEHHVQIICGSTVTNFHFFISFDETRSIVFNVGRNGHGTTGFCRMCIPRALMNEPYRVFVDGPESQVNLLPFSNDTHIYLYFNYFNHDNATQLVEIIPEFPTWISILLILTILTVAIVFYKRRLLKTQIQ